jgi:hypothetical protein
VRKVTKVTQALPHLERLVITFRDACGLEELECHDEDGYENEALTEELVVGATNLKEFWIVSSCFAYGASSDSDGTVHSQRVSVCKFGLEDPIFPWWCRRDD